MRVLMNLNAGRQRGCQRRQGWSTAAAHLNMHPGGGSLGKAGRKEEPLSSCSDYNRHGYYWHEQKTTVHFGLLSLAGEGQLVRIWGRSLNWFKDRHWLHFLRRKTRARSQKLSFSRETVQNDLVLSMDGHDLEEPNWRIKKHVHGRDKVKTRGGIAYLNYLLITPLVN